MPPVDMRLDRVVLVGERNQACQHDAQAVGRAKFSQSIVIERGDGAGSSFARIRS